MIATAIFLFLLGTKAVPTSAIQSDVLYEPSRIAISEQIDQGPVLVPESGPPPYVSNVVHQGSNYFFGMPFPPAMPQPALEPPAQKIVTEVIEKRDCKNLKIMCNPEITDFVVRKSKPEFINPVMEKVDARKVFQNPKLSLPIPNISLNVQPIPYLPSVPILNINSQLLSQLPLPLDSIKIPGLPLLKSSKIPKEPILIEGPYQTPNGFISEVDVLVNKIPPPPKLPPLEIEDFFKPVIVEDKSIILVPAFPEMQEVLPPPIAIAGSPCQRTLCAQDIVFERVLPNIVCEKSKTVELISIPATNRIPVVAAPFLPFIKK